MTGNRRLVACLLLLLILPVPGWAAEFLVGAASRVVTPPLGHLLAGYGRDRAATGVHSPLYARALVLYDGETKLALVTLDSIGLTRPDIKIIAELAAEKVPGLDAGRVVVSSTHTHAGPDVVGLWGESIWRSGRDDAYMRALYERTVEAVYAANKAATPATSKVASRQVEMPWVENRSEPDLLDATLSVMQFVDGAGRSIATLTNFACHPTVLDGENTLISSDYVGAFYQAMTDFLPGEHLFLQGAIGGWVQPLVSTDKNAPQDDLLQALDRFGRDVAAAAQGLIAIAGDNPLNKIDYRRKEFDIPLDNWRFDLLMWLGVLERDSVDGGMRTEAAWFRLGTAEFVTHPGETSPAWSLASRQLMQSEHTFVLGLTQDALGYILKPEYFADDVKFPHAEYLRSVSVGAEAGPRLMATLAELVPKSHK